MIATIADLFYDALKYQRTDALAAKQDGAYQGYSHEQVQNVVECVVCAFAHRGFQAGERLAILSENRPAWAIVDYACAISGVVSVPIYHAISMDQAVFMLKDSGTRYLCIANTHLLGKLQEHLDKLPDLSLIIVFDDMPCTHDSACPVPLVTLPQLLFEGQKHLNREAVKAMAKARTPDDLLTIIYTSGTTSDPKGAMLSHGNLTSNVLTSVEAELDSLNPRPGDRALSVLPLSHIFERMVGHYTMFHLGVGIYYAESLLSLPLNLQEVKPNIMAAVPRIFEKIYAKVRDAASGESVLTEWLFRWATDICHRVVKYLYLDLQPPPHLRLPWVIADQLLLSKVRDKTGGKLRFAISGGAPLSPHVMEFFWAMGIPIYEGYGLTETSPILTATRRGKVKPGYVGPPIMKTWQNKPFLKFAEDGEILCYGPNVMQGYWQNEAATREVMDEEGYFHTGDVGEIDPQGRVKITDRKKELIVTSGGKKVAPQPIENLLRDDLYIEQAMLIGNNQDHVAALIVPNVTTLKVWCKKQKIPFEKLESIIKNPKVIAFYKNRIEKINQSLSNFERIWHFILLDQEMSVENGQLTSSLKIKRRVVMAAHKDKIDKLFENS